MGRRPKCEVVEERITERADDEPDDKDVKVVQSMRNDIIPPLDVVRMEIFILGLTPLVVNRYEHKLEDESKKEKEDLMTAVKRSCYILQDGRHAVPEKALRSSMLNALPYLPKHVSTKAQKMNGLFHIMPPDGEGDMIPLYFDKVVPTAKPGRNMNSKDGKIRTCIIKRARYPNWGFRCWISFNQTLISKENLVTIASYAGYHAGLCEMRPERRGSFGMFRPVSEAEFEKAVKKMKGHLKTDWPATILE